MPLEIVDKKKIPFSVFLHERAGMNDNPNVSSKLYKEWLRYFQ